MKTAFWIIVVLGIAFFAAWSSGLMSQFSTSQITERTLVTLPAKPKTIRALGYIEPVSELRRLVFKVDGVIGLKDALLARKALFLRHLAGKMLAYGLGRGLEYYDAPAVKQIAEHLGQRDYRATALILEVVNSYPFQWRRGEDAPKDVVTSP